MIVAGLQERQDTATAVARLLSFGQKGRDGDNDGNSEGERPTAIITSNDHLALDVVQELQARDITIGSGPGCMAVTGFDDLPFTAYVQPSLTTVRQPIAAISDILLDLLVLIIKNETESKKRVSLSAKAVKLEQYARPGTTQRADPAQRGENSDPPTRWIGPMQALVEPEIVIRDSA
jgi:DNA-binding LacI/PurR family transcriptional regulator